MWGAGLAFVADAIVTVVVTLFTTPKPVSELQGLVYGMANVDESVHGRNLQVVGVAEAARLHRPRPRRHRDHHLLVSP